MKKLRTAELLTMSGDFDGHQNGEEIGWMESPWTLLGQVSEGELGISWGNCGIVRVYLQFA